WEQTRAGETRAYACRFSGSRWVRSTSNVAIFAATAATYAAPLAAVAALGSPTPVSAVTWVQRRGAQAQPSLNAGVRHGRVAPGPASGRGRTRSGARCWIMLVSASPACSPGAVKYFV